MLADLFPTIVLIVALIVLAKVQKAKDPVADLAVITREKNADRSAARRDARAMTRRKSAGKTIAAGIWAVSKATGRVARRRAMLAATAVAVVALLWILGNPATTWAVGPAAIAAGALAGRTITARRVTKSPLDPIPPTVVPLKQSFQMWLDATLKAPRKHLIRGSVAALLPLVAYWPGAVAGMIAAFGVIVTVAAVARWADRPLRKHLIDEQLRERAELGFKESLAVAAGCAPYDLDLHATSTEYRRVVLVPGKSHARLSDDLDGALVKAGLSQWEGELQATPNPVTGGSDLWLTLTPATAETVRRRELLASSDGMVVGAQTRGPRTELILAHGTSPARAEAVDAWADRELHGARLVEWDPYNDRAAVERLTPASREVRARLAKLTRTHPHELVVEIDEGPEHIEQVRIPDAPVLSTDPAKAREAWRNLVLAIPGGSVGWPISIDAVTGLVTLTWGAAPELPNLAPLGEVLPANFDPDSWARPVFGVDATGRPSSINLRRAPHLLVVGATGSGKTALINAQIASRLMRGHEVAVIETEKKFVDFRPLLPFLSAATEWTPGEDEVARYARAVAIFEYLRVEADRRAEIIQAHNVQAMWELPATVRAEHNIRPVTIVTDEADGAFEPLAVPKSQDKDDPRVLEAVAVNEQKALLNYHVAYFAKTYRSVGFNLITGLQRADVAALGGSDPKLGGRMRANHPGGIFLVTPGQEPDAEGLRMIFKSAADEASETRRVFDDRNAGLALTSVDDAPGVTAVRVGYAPVREIVGLLMDRAVPQPSKWDIRVAEPQSPSTRARRPMDDKVTGRRIEEPAPPAEDEVVDLGTVDIDFGDMFGDPEPVTPASPNPWDAAAAARADLAATVPPQVAAGVEAEGPTPPGPDPLDDLFGTPRRALTAEERF